MAGEEPYFDYQAELEQGDLEMGAIFDEEAEEEAPPLGDPWADAAVPAPEDPEIAETAALTAYVLVPAPVSQELLLFPDYPTISGATVQQNHLSNRQLVRIFYLFICLFSVFL